MSHLGERVRLYRQRARMSQTDLAGEDLSPSYVSLIESGKRHPSADVLRTLADRLGCSVTDLDASTSPADLTAARLELSYARLALTNGEPDSARDRLRLLLDSGPLIREIEQEALLILGEAHQLLNDLPQAIRIRQSLFDECLAGRCHLPVAVVAYPLCFSYLTAGDLQAAVRVGERAVRASTEAGLGGTEDHLKLEATLMLAYVELGDLALAWTKSTQIIEAARAAGSETGEGAAYWNAALVAEARGELRQALDLSERALELFARGGPSRNLVRLQLQVAWFLLANGLERAEQGTEMLDRALPLLQDLGAITERAQWEWLRALAHLLHGEAVQAEQLARRALLHLGDAGEHKEMAQAAITLGDVLVSQGRREQGLQTYRQALEALQPAPPSRRTAALYRELAHRYELAADTAAAQACLHRALDAVNVQGSALAGEIAFGLRAPLPAAEASQPEAQRMPSALFTSWS